MKKEKLPVPTEYEEMCVFVKWLELKGYLFSHIPNETWTNSWKQKMKNKKQGVRKGVPDFIIIKDEVLIFLEMKRKTGGAISKEQKNWIEKLNKCAGVVARVVKGTDEAIKFIETISSSSAFPSATLAADLVPEGWKIVEDVAPSEFNIADLKFLSFLKEGESFVTGKTMRERAVAMKGNLGLADAKRFLAEQEKIPRGLRDFYIVFPGTVVRDPYGCLNVACLSWRDACWFLDWYWLGRGWYGRVRFACSE